MVSRVWQWWTRAQSLFMCFGGERRLEVRLTRSRGFMGRDEEKIASLFFLRPFFLPAVRKQLCDRS